jgi:hypothetical protein
VLQERAKPERVYRIAIAAGQAGCAARLERVAPADVVLSCLREQPVGLDTLHKFDYDVRAKALLGHRVLQPFLGKHVTPRTGGAVLVASDAERLIAVAATATPGGDPRFEILSGVDAEPWIARAGNREELLRLFTAGLGPLRFEPQRVGRFILAVEGTPMGPRAAVFDSQSGARHPLPQSTFAQFAAARPGRVRDGYRESVTMFDEQIGPWQIAEDKLWFGKTFYDSEGMTGIGGFGYFDPLAAAYRLWSPLELADWSVSAIQVERDAVWLALVRNGEYGGTSGGILRFDRRIETVQRFDTPDLVFAFFRAGDRLLAATDFGIGLIEDGRVRRFFVDQTTDGRLQVSEAVR